MSTTTTLPRTDRYLSGAEANFVLRVIRWRAGERATKPIWAAGAARERELVAIADRLVAAVRKP